MKNNLAIAIVILPPRAPSITLMTSSHTGLYFSNKVHTFRAASSSVKFGNDLVDFDDSVITGYAETASFVTESAFVVDVIKSFLCPDDVVEACFLKMFNNVSISRDSCCLFSKAFLVTTKSKTNKDMFKTTTTDNETNFFNQKNFLIGFIDDIYDYIFIAWIVISNISLSLGIKFKKDYTNDYKSNGHDHDQFMQPPPPQNFPDPAQLPHTTSESTTITAVPSKSTTTRATARQYTTNFKTIKS